MIHKWYGRVFIVLGVVTGGSGLALASDSPAYSKAGMISYAVLSGVFGIALVGLWTWVEINNRGPKKVANEGSEANGA